MTTSEFGFRHHEAYQRLVHNEPWTVELKLSEMTSQSDVAMVGRIFKRCKLVQLRFSTQLGERAVSKSKSIEY